jgi:hypothetical protein
MKSFLIIATLVAAATSAHAGPNVGVSIDIHPPGVYGRVTIGSVLPPVVLPRPVIIVPSRVAVVQQPIYLHVPVVHQTHWSRHCAAYAACSQPVYFVQETWVREQAHRGRHGHARGHGHGHAHGHAHGHDNGHPGKHKGHHKNKHRDRHAH